MRTLIVLTILLSCSAVGQMTYILPDMVASNDTIVTVVQFDTQFVRTFVHLYDQYAKECYADSFTVRTDTAHYPQHGELVLTNPEYTDIWHHHEPTFPGFMDWLRRKGK